MCAVEKAAVSTVSTHLLPKTQKPLYFDTVDTPAAPTRLRSGLRTSMTQCAQCSRKTGLLGFSCKCNKVFCSMHRSPELHSCGFNYKAAHTLQLTINNKAVVARKIAKI